MNICKRVAVFFFLFLDQKNYCSCVADTKKTTCYRVFNLAITGRANRNKKVFLRF